MIYIDTREPSQWKKRVSKLCDKKNIDYEFRTLKYGDYMSDKAIIERKDILDLYNSMISKRLTRQISGITRYAYNNRQVPYLLIHGNVSKLYSLVKKGIISDFNVDTIYGLCSSLIVRYNVNIIWLPNTTSACRSIVGILTKSDGGKVMKNDWSIEFLKARLLGVNEEEYERLIDEFGDFLVILL